MNGLTMSHYRIVRELGRGGMGIVYEAEDARLGRKVAIKVLPPTARTDQSDRARFHREARAAAALSHPNIATIHEIDEAVPLNEDGRAVEHSDTPRLFIVMELVEGESLKERLERGALSVDESVGIVRDIARALQAAHEKGIVHRDIKPQNVMLTTAGEAKVLDFGLARTADSATITRMESTAGTIAYMSPEQARGDVVDARSDIWSLGVVLYELIVGRRPFRGDYEAAVIYSVTNENPAPPSSYDPNLPDELDRIARKALEKSPEDRYTTIGELLADLDELDSDAASREKGRLHTVHGSFVHGLAASRRGFVPILWVAAIVIIALAAITLIQLLPVDGGKGAVDSVAVLPLRNVSNDADQEYFADGLTEELIVALGKVADLKVAARTSSFAFKQTDLPVTEVGERLGVAAILEGSVRKSGNSLRISVHLSEVASGFELWSEIYDGDLSDVFTVQEQIASEVIGALQIELAAGQVRPFEAETENVAAYEAYLKGRFFWGRRTEAALKTAVRYFEEAIAHAPRYARAHAGLADAHNILGFYDWLPPREAFPRAKESAERALELNPLLAEAANSLGYYYLYFEWDAEASEREFRRAIEIDPRYPVAHQWYGNFLVASGRLEEAHREIRLASELDPLAVITKAAVGWTSYYAKEMRVAIKELEAALELDPDLALTHMWIALARAHLDEVSEAVQTIERAVELSNQSPGPVAMQAYILARAGRTDEARGLVERLEAERTQRYVAPYDLAKVYFALGDVEAGYASLEQAFEDRSHSMVFLTVDPELEPWSDEPRYRDLVRRVGFAQP